MGNILYTEGMDYAGILIKNTLMMAPFQLQSK